MQMARQQEQAAEADEALLARFARGDQAAARELVSRHLPRVFATASRMLGDRTEAEDIAQEAMLRLWKIAPDWQTGRAQVSTWLYRVASNLCIDRIRRRSRIDPREAPDRADDAPGSEAQLQTRARSRALHAALVELPERQRLAIMLRHFEGHTNPDIAARLEVSVDAVESLLARGRRTLSKKLASQRDALGLIEN